MAAFVVQYLYMHRHKLHNQTVFFGEQRKKFDITYFSIFHYMLPPLDQPTPQPQSSCISGSSGTSKDFTLSVLL